MAGISESNRVRVSAALLALSSVLLLIGFGIIVFQPDTASIPYGQTTTRPAAAPHSAQGSGPAPAMNRDAKAKAMRTLLFWALVLFMVLVTSTFAFLRWSRSFRRWVFRKPRPPTPSADVWAMHKLPEGAVEEWGGEPEPPETPRSRDG